MQLVVLSLLCALVSAGNHGGGDGGNHGGGDGNNHGGNGGGNPGLGNVFGSSNVGFDLALAGLFGNTNDERNRHPLPRGPPPTILRTVYVEPAPVLVAPALVAEPVVFIAKCLIGSPWKDAVTGLDLLCGPFSGNVVCPLGSQCIAGPSLSYFSCCSVPA